MSKLIIKYFIYLIIITFGCSCSEDMEIKVSHIDILNIDENGLTLEAESTFQVEAVTQPDNAARGGITYKSSDDNIFTVSAKGLISAHSVGKAELTVKTQDGTYLSETREIEVSPKSIPIESIEILGLDEDGFLILPFDGKFRILLSLTPENANTAVSYHSSNPDIFTVDEEGYATGFADGEEAELTVRSVKDPDITASCKIKVVDLSIQDIIIPEENISLEYLGDQYQLGEKIVVIPSTAPRDRIEYSSSNDEVASVSQNGVITAKSKGEAIVTLRTTDGTDIEKTVNVQVEAELHYDGWSVTASSYNASQGTPEAILVDGDKPFWHSKWEGGEAPLPHWLLIDMKEEKLITEFLVERRGYNNDLRKAIVEISRDGETFTQVGILDWGGVPKEDYIRFVAFAKQNARYIKLTITESNRGNVASINRVRVYGVLE